MSTTDLKCVQCGVVASKRPDISAPPLACQRCAYVDLPVSFCNPKCYDAGLERHEKKGCAGPSNRRIVVEDPASWKHFCTPACQVKLVTPRLNIRPVELSDNERIISIKTETIVNKTQLYGNPQRSMILPLFTKDYVTDLVPSVDGMHSKSSKGRERYVFALEPRVDKEGKRMLEPNTHPGVEYDLDANGYIGNLAIEVTPDESLGGRFPSLLVPYPNSVFEYPSIDDMEITAYAMLFYELHPNFQRQGLMTEAIKEVNNFCFNTLRLPRVVIDPLASNVASLKLAETLGFKQVGEKMGRKGLQKIFELTRADWEKGRKAKKGSKKKKKPAAAVEGVGEGAAASEAAAADADDPPEVAAGFSVGGEEPCCRWCQIPSTIAKLGCSGCPFAFWCSQPCKTADLTWVNGHARVCPGKQQQRK